MKVVLIQNTTHPPSFSLSLYVCVCLTFSLFYFLTLSVSPLSLSFSLCCMQSFEIQRAVENGLYFLSYSFETRSSYILSYAGGYQAPVSLLSQSITAQYFWGYRSAQLCSAFDRSSGYLNTGLSACVGSAFTL